MKQFIFHIGMHKCASTTLQNKVFRYEPGAIGTHQELDFEINFGKQFQRLSPVGGRQFGSISGVKEWVERVNNYQNETDPHVDRFIVSSEFLCQSNKLSDRPIIKFLDEINQKILNGNSIKVIIIFRKQSEMMASEYAQISRTHYNSSQIDFEKWVTRRLNQKNRLILDWGGWAESLVDTFGRDNVCILLLEEMQELGFWEELVSFIDARKITAEELHENNTLSKLNTRKVDKKTWELTPFDLQKKAKNDVHKVKYFLSGIGFNEGLTKKPITHMISMRIKYLRLMGYKDNHLLDSNISLNPEIESKIRSAFKDSNAKLSTVLRRDICDFGY